MSGLLGMRDGGRDLGGGGGVLRLGESFGPAFWFCFLSFLALYLLRVDFLRVFFLDRIMWKQEAHFIRPWKFIRVQECISYPCTLCTMGVAVQHK